MKKKMGILVAAAIMTVAMSGAATASTITNGFTFGVTEGNGQNRKTVVGTNDLDVDSRGATSLGTLRAGDVFGIYGRIVSAVDTFTFTFESLSDFEIAFDLDGYDAFKSGASGDTIFVEQSGLINQSILNNKVQASDAGGKEVKFSLTGDGSTSSTTRTTNLTGDNATELQRVLFTGTANTLYTFVVDGQDENTAALYDINITATPVPLPAGLVLLLTGVAGFGALRRHQSA